MAAGAEGIRAGRAFVEIGADLNPLDKGLNDAKQRLSAFSGALASLGSALALSFATSKITGWVDAFAQGGREISVMARNAGVGTAELSDLKSAVELLGGNFEETVGSMRKMGIFLENVRTGSSEARDAINRLGISFAELNGLSETDKLQKIGEKLAALPLNLRQHLGQQIFGKRGGATVGLATALGAARAQTAGQGPDAEEIRVANDLALALVALEKAQKGVGDTIGGLLAPGFLAVTNAMTGAYKVVKEWIKENGELVQKIALIGSVVVGASTALLALATGISLVGFAAGGIAAVFAGLFALVTSFASIVAFAFTPFGALAAAAVATLIDLGNITGAFDAIGRAASRLKDIFNTTFGGIKDAIGIGDLGAAWEIALAGMKVAWLEFQMWIAETTGLTLDNILSQVKEIAGVVAALNPSGAIPRAPDAFGRDIIANAAARNRGLPAPGGTVSPEAQALRDQAAAVEAQLEALNRDAFYRNYSAQAARDLENLPNMDDIGQQLAGTSRGTFNRDVLFGFGGTPMQQLISSTKAIVDQLGPILHSIDENIQLVSLDVS